MKKLFFLFVAFIATTTLWAYDFQVDGLCYNVLPGKDKRVELTF